jgi:3-oxoadipate enol-lactonase
VLFLHGIGGHRHHWSLQLEALSENFKAAAWDARGYGDSGDYEGPLRFSDFVSDVIRVLDHFEAPKAHLVGLSMGGRIAREVALRHPERLASLTLANTSPGFDALSPEQVRKFVEERKNRTPESMQALLGSQADPGAHGFLIKGFNSLHRESYLKTLEASVSQDRAAPVENIRVRTLVITGNEDKVYPAPIAQDLARRIPGARLVALEGCGHLSNLEQPERFNRVLMEFLMENDK